MQPDDTPQRALRDMTLTVAKYRSNIAELFPEVRVDDDALLALLQPWVFGPKCILPTLERLQEKGDALTWLDVYNPLVVAHQLEPSIALASELLFHRPLPAPLDAMRLAART